MARLTEKTIVEQLGTEATVELLDDAVHAAASRAASNINNQGIQAQLDYLIEQDGAAAIEDWIEQVADLV